MWQPPPAPLGALRRWAVEQLLKAGKSVLLSSGSITSVKDASYLQGLATRAQASTSNPGGALGCDPLRPTRLQCLSYF